MKLVAKRVIIQEIGGKIRGVYVNNKRRVLVVGAGIAGLTCAYKLAEEGLDVVLVEKEEKVGGLARTFNYGKYRYDIGPHRFYSSKKDVLNFLYSVMKDDLLEIVRFSAVHYCDRYHTWPLRLKSVFQLPLRVSFPAFLDLFTKSKYQKLKEPSFKNYILGKYGNTLYETFFKGYTEKFLGLSPEEVHFHWAKIGVERATIDKNIKTGSISQLFYLMMIPKPRQLNFLYPPGGIDVFCSRMRDRIIEMGGKVITGKSPGKIEHDGQNITSVQVGDEIYRPDMVIWTAPITTLFDLMNLDPTGLKYLSLLIFNLEMNEPPLQDYQWCYFGSEDVIFSRATNPAQFDKNMIPQNTGALCVEVTCMEDSKTWQHPEKLNDDIIDGMVRAKSISSKNVVKNIHIERIPDTYPIYDIDYLEKLSIVREKLRKFHNLFLAGRTGLFWYNNMDHSIENAFGVVEKVVGHTPETAHKRLEDPFHLGAAVGDPSCAMVKV